MMFNKRTGKGQSTKSTIVEILQSEGYGFVDACEHAEKFLKEIKAKGPGNHTVYTRTQELTFRVGKNN